MTLRSSDRGRRIAPWLAGVFASACIDTSRQATCPLPPGEATPKKCAAGIRPSDDGLIDDMEDGDSQLAKAGDRNGYWFSSHDPNGSVIDPSPLTMAAGGAGGSQKALHVFGQTSSVSGAWGVIVGASFVGEGVYDASKYAGISFKAKVSKDSTKTIRFKVADVNTHPDGGICKTCWNHFGKDVELTTEWQDYEVPFVEMKQEPGWGDPFPALTSSKVVAMNWSLGPGRAFEVWIDDVAFFECK